MSVTIAPVEKTPGCLSTLVNMLPVPVGVVGGGASFVMRELAKSHHREYTYFQGTGIHWGLSMAATSLAETLTNPAYWSPDPRLRTFLRPIHRSAWLAVGAGGALLEWLHVGSANFDDQDIWANFGGAAIAHYWPKAVDLVRDGIEAYRLRKAGKLYLDSEKSISHP